MLANNNYCNFFFYKLNFFVFFLMRKYVPYGNFPYTLPSDDSLRQHYFTLLIGLNCYGQIFAAFSAPNSDPTLKDHIKVLKIILNYASKNYFYLHFISFNCGLSLTKCNFKSIPRSIRHLKQCHRN